LEEGGGNRIREGEGPVSKNREVKRGRTKRRKGQEIRGK